MHTRTLFHSLWRIQIVKQQWKAQTKQTQHRPWLALTYPLFINKAIRFYCLRQVIFWIFNTQLFVFLASGPKYECQYWRSPRHFPTPQFRHRFFWDVQKQHKLSEKTLLPGPLSTERNSRASSLSHNVPRGNFFTGSSSERMRPWAVQPTRALHGKHVTARRWWNHVRASFETYAPSLLIMNRVLSLVRLHTNMGHEICMRERERWISSKTPRRKWGVLNWNKPVSSLRERSMCNKAKTKLPIGLQAPPCLETLHQLTCAGNNPNSGGRSTSD